MSKARQQAREVVSDGDESRRFLLELPRARREGDVNALVAALEVPKLAPRATRYLIQLGATVAFPEIAKLLQSNDPACRAQAARAVGAFGDPSWRDQLEALSRPDPDPRVRSWALHSLATLLGSAARPSVSAALKDYDWRVRMSAAVALGNIGDPSDRIELENAKSVEPFWRRKRYRVAIRQLANRGAS